MIIMMKRFLFAVCCSILLSTAFASSSWAVIASPFPYEVEQPDGTRVIIVNRGDEFLNWKESPDGYPIVKNKKTGNYEFAVKNNGKFVSSGVVYRSGATPPDFVSRHESPDLSSAVKTRSASRKERAVAWWKPRPLEGTRKIMLIRVSFNDIAIKQEMASHESALFGEEKSVRRYYSDQSHGKLQIVPAIDEFKVIDVTLDYNHPNEKMSYYPEITPEEEEAMHAVEARVVSDVLNAALAKTGDSLDRFDNDGDGVVTADELCVYMIMAGYEASVSGPFPSIWAHAWESIPEDGPDHTVSVNGKILDVWAMNGELMGDEVPMGIGVIAHELGHQLCKLPDLYDISYTNGGLGVFSLMASGSWGTVAYKDEKDMEGFSPVNLDAWSRQYLGWEIPQDVKGPIGDVIFKSQLGGYGKGSVRLYARGLRSSEYFLAEPRTLNGWDAGLSGISSMDLLTDSDGGLLIIHVDEEVGLGRLESGNDINDLASSGRQGVMAVDARHPDKPHVQGEATTRELLWWGGNTAVAGSSSKGAGRTIDFSEPASNFYAADEYIPSVPSGISITGIGDPGPGGTLTASAANGGQPAPMGQSLSSSSGCSFVFAPGLLVFAGIFTVCSTKRHRHNRRID